MALLNASLVHIVPSTSEQPLLMFMLIVVYWHWPLKSAYNLAWSINPDIEEHHLPGLDVYILMFCHFELILFFVFVMAIKVCCRYCPVPMLPRRPTHTA